ncbi:MAG: bifunctional oligoribonuclease/PAP phosphatase NrnA [Gemmatimonadales bacterium]
MSENLSSRAQSRGVAVSQARRRAAKEITRVFKRGQRVALTTHVNADGDGAGSEVALWHMLRSRGVRPVIVNPTPFPERYGFLLTDCPGADKSPRAVKHLEAADVIVVLDISDVGRLGHLGRVVEQSGKAVACIDHHETNGTLPPGPRMIDAAACATGELVYDLARAANWELSAPAARALYVAILTDTGSFRFANTTPRTLQIAAHLLGHGVDPEEMYRAVYASEPEGRVRLLAEVLETLVVEREHRLAWVTVPPGALERHGVDAADLEGVVEIPRSIAGVDLAILFRELANGRIKVSLRSVGEIDVARLASLFGGGGHKRAAGASLDGTLAEVQARVLAAARDALTRSTRA